MTRRVDVVVVGSGFAGSILARVLARQGHRVALLEKGRHPRFALGESSTPLAALALERLARRWDLPDLRALAAWGRWRDELPELRRGLKRGFSFYRHRPAVPFDSRAEPADRLLVAASPSDAVADVHWWRADVDGWLLERASAEGVTTLQEARVTEVAEGPRGLSLQIARTGGASETLEASLAVDATGAAGAVARRLGAGEGPPLLTRSGLVASHFEGALPWAEVVDEAAGTPTPYPQESAAVHHLLDEGWLYSLRFDEGTVSAGLLIAGGLPRDADPASVWAWTLERHPTLRRQLGGARPVRSPTVVPTLQRRLDRAAGPCWVALPHTFGFVDPLFSTGIAWSLLGVERLADLLADDDPRSPAIRDGSAFEPYAALLGYELEQIDRLVAGAYAVRRRFPLFVAHSMLYFTLVSFAEAEQRLRDLERPAWRGFLRADESRWRRTFAEALTHLRRLRDDPLPRALQPHATWIEQVTREVNVAGLCQPDGRLYGVDLDALVAAAPLLGMAAADVRAALPRLRGA